MAVCGLTENRHGIVLTKSYPAKGMGAKTNMANWEAKQTCPNLIIVEPHYGLCFMARRAWSIRMANSLAERLCDRLAHSVCPARPERLFTRRTGR